jgi:hypothetical protein
MIKQRKLAAAEQLSELDPDVWFDNARGFTCGEAEVVAEFLRVFYEDWVAERFMECHAERDEPGDDHYQANDEHDHRSIFGPVNLTMTQLGSQREEQIMTQSSRPPGGMTALEAAQKLYGESPTDEQIRMTEESIQQLVQLGFLETGEA